MLAFCGGVPSNAILPVIVAAVEASTFFASGAAFGDEGLADSLLLVPPQAAAPSSAAKTIGL